MMIICDACYEQVKGDDVLSAKDQLAVFYLEGKQIELGPCCSGDANDVRKKALAEWYKHKQEISSPHHSTTNSSQISI